MPRLFNSLRTVLAVGTLALLCNPISALGQLTFTVDQTGDAPDVVPGDGICDTGAANSPSGSTSKTSVGMCSLRAAIEEANATAGHNTIDFFIDVGSDPGCAGPFCIIRPESELPAITDTVLIEGLSQPASDCATADSRTLTIQLSGDSLHAGESGLWLSAGADFSTIRGLVINGFPNHGIHAASVGTLTIQCNHIGTNSTGTSAIPNGGHGIFLESSSTGTGHIGADSDGVNDAAEGNLVSGNAGWGIYLDSGSADNRVSANRIGVNLAGTMAIPNGTTDGGGLLVRGSNNLIGTNSDGISDDLEGNIVSGNDGDGVWIDGASATGNVVAGNRIGVGVSDTDEIGNTGAGVRFSDNAGSNLVGILDPVAGESGANIIAYNDAQGILVASGVENSILGNSTFENDGLGIDLSTVGVDIIDADDPDEGANRRQNPPEILSATDDLAGGVTISFYVDTDPANAAYPLHIEFFLADVDTEEGEQLLIRSSYTMANWNGCGTAPCSIQILRSGDPIPLDSWIVGTATDVDGNTSEFSEPFAVTPETCVKTLTVRAFLQGPYDQTSNRMHRTLAAGGSVPLEQPFDDPVFDGTQLSFSGELTVSVIPDSAVDWVLVELRATPGGGPRATVPAFISRDGFLFTPDQDGLCSPINDPGMYHLAVAGRNHLKIMSATKLDLTGSSASYDFTTSATQAYPGDNPTAQKLLEAGVYGLFAGDATVDGQITASDYNKWLPDTKAALTGYRMSDFSMDGQVTATDFNLWLTNTKAAASTKVPAINPWQGY